jgi:hypothetical protein
MLNYRFFGQNYLQAPDLSLNEPLILILQFYGNPLPVRGVDKTTKSVIDNMLAFRYKEEGNLIEQTTRLVNGKKWNRLAVEYPASLEFNTVSILLSNAHSEERSRRNQNYKLYAQLVWHRWVTGREIEPTYKSSTNNIILMTDSSQLYKLIANNSPKLQLNIYKRHEVAALLCNLPQLAELLTLEQLQIINELYLPWQKQGRIFQDIIKACENIIANKLGLNESTYSLASQP